MNVKDGADMWMHPVPEINRELLMARKLGYFDEFGCYLHPQKTDSELEDDMRLCEDAKKYRVFDN